VGVNLITGGLGFLGASLARQLVMEHGEEAILFQRTAVIPPGAEDLKPRVKVVAGDVSNWVDVSDAVKTYHPDCIYHTAALLSGPCEAKPSAGFNVNLVGTFNILEVARIHGVSHVMFVSSGSLYGFLKPKRITDVTPQAPEDMYGVTKLCSEALGRYYQRRYGVQFRGIRLAMVIGPGRQLSYYYGDYSGAIQRAAQGKSYTVHVDPTTNANLIYVKDAARALIMLRQAEPVKLRQNVYNVHGFTTTMLNVVKMIKRHIPDAQIDFSTDTSEAMVTANRAVDFEMDDSAARDDFAWEPRFSLAETTEDFIAEVRAGRGV